MQDSVPAALTKDKKRIDGQEVAVHLAWQSTLYVTNFPEKADDTFIRTLFAKVCRYEPGNPLPDSGICLQYGTIFDVRWPSKKFKATRRFCYVQFSSPVRLPLCTVMCSSLREVVIAVSASGSGAARDANRAGPVPERLHLQS